MQDGELSFTELSEGMRSKGLAGPIQGRTYAALPITVSLAKCSCESLTKSIHIATKPIHVTLFVQVHLAYSQIMQKSFEHRIDRVLYLQVTFHSLSASSSF
jgi:hypothetical protein